MVAAACVPSPGQDVTAADPLAAAAAAAIGGVTATSTVWNGGTEVAPVDSGPQAVGAPDFSFAAAPASQTIAPPTTGTALTGYLVEMGSIEEFASPVTLKVSGLPAGSTAAFVPANVTPDGYSIMTISISATTPTGVHPLVITGTSGALSHSATVNLAVEFGLVPKCLVTLRGTVTDVATGEPLAGAKAAIGNRSTTTAADGTYSFANLELGPNNRPLAFNLTASKDAPALNHIGTYWSASISTVGVCGREPVANLALTKSIPANVTGTVVDGHLVDGQPVPKPGNTPVSGITATIAGTATDVTDVAGLIQFVDNSGKTGIMAGPNNTLKTGSLVLTGSSSLPARQRYWRPAAIPISVEAGATQAVGIIPIIRQCTAKVTGKVTTPGGAGIAGVKVTSVPLDEAVNDTINVTTGADGTYTIPEQLFGVNNAPNQLELTFSSTLHLSKVVTTNEVTCGSVATVNAVLDANTATTTTTSTTTTTAPTIYNMRIEGKVVDAETNAPIQDITVQLNKCLDPVGGLCWDPAVTNASGNYVIEDKFTTPTNEPVAATRIVTVLPTSPPPDYWTAPPVEFNIQHNVTAKPADLKLLKRRFGAVAGVVTDSATGLPIPGVAMKTNGVPRDLCEAPCVTDAQGRYAFSRVDLNTNNADKAGTVSATLDGYWPKSLSMTYKADTTTELNLPMLKICPGGTVFGRVVNATTKAPIPNATISTTGSLTATTNQDGAYELGVIPIGTNNTPVNSNITATAAGFYTSTLRTTITCGSRNELNFGFSPVITGIDPTSGPTTGGTTVTITGKDLAGVTAVRFGTVPAVSFAEVSPTQVTAVSPAGVAGVVNVVVATPGGASGPSSASEFRYIPPAPRITGVDPSSGPTTGGTTVTITGTNLADASAVTFGALAATSFSVTSPTQIVAVTPASSAGTVDVKATTPGGTSTVSATAKYTFTTGPTSTTTTTSSTTSTTSTSVPTSTSSTTSSTTSTSTTSSTTSTSTTSTTSTSTTSTTPSTTSTTTSTTIPTSTSTTSTSTTTTAPTSTTTTTIKPPTTTTPPPTPQQVATVVAVVIWLVWLLFFQ